MTRNYSKVPDDKRQRLIEMINMNMTIKDAARRVDIKYENAKAIYRVYRKEQRTSKRRNRFRYKLGEDTPKPAAKTITKRGAAKKPKFESKMQTRAIKRKEYILEEDESALEDDDDDVDSLDDESMLDEEEEKDSADPFTIANEKQKRVTVSVRVPKNNSPVKSEAQSMMMAVPSKRPRQVQNSSMTVVRPTKPSGKMQNFEQNAPHSTNNLLNTLRGLDPNAKPKDGVQSAWNKQGTSDNPKEVQLQNMVAFSDQTSSFLRAKNMTAEGVVRENAEVVPDKPIKYGNELFQLLNSQNKAIQSKEALKNNYMQLMPNQFNDYKQQAKDYDNMMNIDLPSQMFVEQAQQPSQETQFQAQQMAQFLALSHQSAAILHQDKKIKLNNSAQGEQCLDIKNQKSLTEQRESANGAQSDQPSSNLQSKKYSNNLSHLVTGMNQGESIENDFVHRSTTNQFMMPVETPPPAGPLRSGNLSGSLQPYPFGQFHPNNGQFKSINMQLSQEMSDFQAMNGQARRLSIAEQQEVMQRLSSDFQSRMMAQSGKNLMFVPGNASQQACKPNLQASQMMQMQPMTTDSQRIDSNILAAMAQFNNPPQLNAQGQPRFGKNQLNDLEEEKQTPVQYQQSREPGHASNGPASSNSGQLPRISEMFKMPFAMGSNCNASPTRQPVNLSGTATTPTGLMQEVDRQKSPHQLNRGLTQAKEHGNQVQPNPFQQQESGRLNSGNMMQLAQSLGPTCNELLMTQEPCAEQPAPIQNRISNLQNNLNFIYNDSSHDKKQNQPKQWSQMPQDKSQPNSQIGQQTENERNSRNLTNGFSNFLNDQNKQKHGLESCPKESVDLSKVEPSIVNNQRATTISQAIATDIASQSPKVTFSGDLCSKIAVQEIQITENGQISEDLNKKEKCELKTQEQVSSVKNANFIPTPSESSKSGNSFADVKKITPRLPYMGQWQALQQQQLYLRHVQEKNDTQPAQGNFYKITSSGHSSQAFQPNPSQPTGDKNASGRMPSDILGHGVVPNLDKNSSMSEPKPGETKAIFAVSKAQTHNSQQQQLYPVGSKFNQAAQKAENQEFTQQPLSRSNPSQASGAHEDVQLSQAYPSGRAIPCNGLQESQNLTGQPSCGRKEQSDKITLKVSSIIQPKITLQNQDDQAAFSQPVRRPSSRNNDQIQRKSDSVAQNEARSGAKASYFASNEMLGKQTKGKPISYASQQGADTPVVMAGQSKQRLDSCSLMLEIGDMDAKVSKSVSSSDDSSYSAASDDHQLSKSASKPAQPIINGQINLFRLPYSQQKVEMAGARQNYGVSSQENQNMKHEKNAVSNEDLQKLSGAESQQKVVVEKHLAQEVAQVKLKAVGINKPAPASEENEPQQQLVRKSNKSHFPMIYQSGMAKPSEEFHKSQHIAPDENKAPIEQWSSQVGAMNGSVWAAWQQEMTELGDLQCLAGRQEGTTAPQNQNGRTSEVTRYMLNQLDQIHIKLKLLGFTNDDLQAEPHTKADQKKQLEQAFTTIDTFGSEVLATYKQQMEMDVQGNKPTSLRMLSSMTKVIQIMQQELKNIKSREESLTQREKALAKSVSSADAPPQIQPPKMTLAQDSVMFDHQNQNSVRPAAGLPQTQAAPMPFEQLLVSQINHLQQQQQVPDLSQQPQQMVDQKIAAAIAQKQFPQDIAQRLLELAVLQQAAQQHQGSRASGSSPHSSFSQQNLNGASQQQKQMQQQMQINSFNQQNTFQGKVSHDQQMSKNFPQALQMNELQHYQQMGDDRALSPEIVQQLIQRHQKLQAMDLSRAHLNGAGADRHPNTVLASITASIPSQSQQQLYGGGFQGSSHMGNAGPNSAPVQYLMPTPASGPPANFIAWNNQHQQQQQQQQQLHQLQMHQAANKNNKNFQSNRK